MVLVERLNDPFDCKNLAFSLIDAAFHYLFNGKIFKYLFRNALFSERTALGQPVKKIDHAYARMLHLLVKGLSENDHQTLQYYVGANVSNGLQKELMLHLI